MKFIKTPVKGMCDMLPADMRLREHVLGMIKETYGACGFMQIETPVMEHIENLTSKQGGDNEKLIFKVMKRGAELQRALDKGDGELADNGLRYDLTVPLARYYANNKEKLPTPFKAMQLGNVWRADNPQKGRFRQFTQCDIDILGDDSSLAEIELITATATMLSKILAEANLNAFTIHINDRRMLAAAALTAGFEQEEIGGALISLDKFDKIGMDGIEKDLLESGYAPEKVEKYTKKTETEIDGIICGIKERRTNKHMARRTPAILTELIAQPFYDKKVRLTSNFCVEDCCIGCGLCAKKCPVQAIRMQNAKPVWVKEKCVMCLGCLHRCPRFAIQYGSRTKNHGQYTNPNVKV